MKVVPSSVGQGNYRIADYWNVTLFILCLNKIFNGSQFISLYVQYTQDFNYWKEKLTQFGVSTAYNVAFISARSQDIISRRNIDVVSFMYPLKETALPITGCVTI